MHPSKPEPDQEFDFVAVLAAAQGGQSDAIDELFRRFYPAVEQMVHRDLAWNLRRSRPWLRASLSTGDVVQEVFRNLLRGLGGFTGDCEDAFRGYLVMVVRNRVVDAIRYYEAAQRDGRRNVELDESFGRANPGTGPATLAARLDSAAHFLELMADFPERQQLLLRDRIEQGTHFQDLADRLGYPSKWAARRAFYAAQAQLVIRLRQRQDRTEG